MSESNNHVTRAVLTLMVLTAIATALLAYGNRITGELRERNQAAYAARTLMQVLPESLYDEQPGLESGFINLPDAAEEAGVQYWPARRDGAVTAVVLAVTTPDGYVAPIELLVGIDRDGEITGVRAASHRETPGLGDAIDADRSPWILGFNGLSLLNPAPSGWSLRRDGGAIDQIIGATVTPT